MKPWMTAAWSAALVVALVGAPTEAKVPDGKPVFAKYKCNSCHSIEAAAVVKKAAPGEEESTSKTKPPDLSDVGLKRKADWISKFLLKKEKHDGELHPKKFRGSEAELKTLAAWLETMKSEKAKDKAEEKTERAAEEEAKDNPGGEKFAK